MRDGLKFVRFWHFAEAFGNVAHNKLLYKLDYCGINSKVLFQRIHRLLYKLDAFADAILRSITIAHKNSFL